MGNWPARHGLSYWLSRKTSTRTNKISDSRIRSIISNGPKYRFPPRIYLSHSTTKQTKWPVCPAKTQISLGIRPVWPTSLIRVFAVRMKTPWVLSYSLSAKRRRWSDWPDFQADLSLRWAHVILLVLSCCSSFQNKMSGGNSCCRNWFR